MKGRFCQWVSNIFMLIFQHVRQREFFTKASYLNDAISTPKDKKKREEE